ncbi:hypothetical protein [Stigmatella aurantiaca]|uniref:Conserved uncharacterized protein n=1 Tax=Stigmatella aurantiaca (strain DW4/3-1) TaxID=378806 RepID=Q094R4_STIAD|nr:hypothetical protein [Stigmatella aurantiaca]ADO73259.1 conserved uncharacterized protein [Stigmatella aurantiaca DW4/3-1]EAU67238.1 hypothetical protein STIAU_7565 [Stigmatella aurantiaca DW4/3-1]
MRTPTVHSRLLLAFLGALALSTPALAQDEDEDAPYAYPDDSEEDAPRKLPRRSDPTADFERMSEEGEDFEKMYRLDDPNTGLAGEVILGAMLLSSSKGAFAETGLGLGLRFTWEYGRILDSEPLREALWADVRWMMAGLSDGTDLISSSSRIHYFTIAPAYEFTFGAAQAFGVFGQVGGGMALQSSQVSIGQDETSVKGIKPLLQYGVGFRGRPRLSDRLALSFRVELTRFRRGYMNDTFIGGSLGTAF